MRPNHGLILAMFFLLLALLPMALMRKTADPLDRSGIAVTVMAKNEDRLYRMDLEQYLVGVLAAEMPARFPLEALKAQAVASRTLAVYRMPRFGGKGSASFVGADFSDDPNEAQAWISSAAMQAKWSKNEYPDFTRKIEQAVRETRGIIVTYQGKPIDAVFHSTCGVGTAAAAEVWGRFVPYLQSATCGVDRDSPRYSNQTQLSWSQFAATLRVSKQNAQQLRVVRRSPQGRILEVAAGQSRFSGKDFRSRLGLTSTCFGWKAGSNGILLQTIGYGHGVGLCQYGTAGFAKQGWNYRQILEHYYQGVQLRLVQ